MSLFLPILSLLLCILVATCYVVRPIPCAAVTVFPTWLWLVPGLFLAGLGWRRRRLAGSVGVLWMLFLLGFAEEPWSLLRGTLPACEPELRGRLAGGGERGQTVSTRHLAIAGVAEPRRSAAARRRALWRGGRLGAWTGCQYYCAGKRTALPAKPGRKNLPDSRTSHANWRKTDGGHQSSVISAHGAC